MFNRLAAAAVAALILAAPAARADEVVRIAYIDPLSGSLAATGQLGEQHFRFAIDRANAAGAAGPGRKLELVALDNEVSPEKSLTLLRKAVDDGVHYVTQGNGSAVAFALVDAINKNNRRAPNQAVMFLNYAAVDPALTNDKCSLSASPQSSRSPNGAPGIDCVLQCHSPEVSDPVLWHVSCLYNVHSTAVSVIR